MLAKSSGLVHIVLGENSSPSSCCFLLLEGHAGELATGLGSLETSERLMRGHCTVLPASVTVFLKSGILCARSLELEWCSTLDEHCLYSTTYRACHRQSHYKLDVSPNERYTTIELLQVRRSLAVP